MVKVFDFYLKDTGVVFFLIPILRYNLHTIKSIHFKCTIK